MPEIPLSVGSKLELLLSLIVFAKFPYTPHTHAFFCVCILPCIYIRGSIHLDECLAFLASGSDPTCRVGCVKSHTGVVLYVRDSILHDNQPSNILYLSNH